MNQADANTSWKLFWAAIGCGATAMTVGVPVILRASLIWRIGAVVLLVLLGGLFAWGFTKVVYRATGMFADVPFRSKPMLTTWVYVAVGLHVVWGVAFTLRTAWWPAWLAALAVMGLLEYAIARALTYLLETAEAVDDPGTAVEVIDQGPALGGDQNVEELKGVFKSAKLGFMTLVRVEPIGNERNPWGMRVILRRPAELVAAAAAQGDSKQRKSLTALDITAAHAEAIAIGMSELTRNPEFESDWVQINKLPAAGTYGVTIVFHDVLGQMYEYVEEIDQRTGLPAFCSIKHPAPVAMKLDGTVATILLKKHGQAIGATLAGKTSFIHTIMAYITKCPDAVLWVCGTEKLWDLLAGWLWCYMGTDLPLPIDWVACGIPDTLEMMVALMNVARYRQNQPMDQRGEWPTVIMIMDEASYILENKTVQVETPYGRRFATAMLADVAKATNSGDAHFLIASQRSTSDCTGDMGPLLSTQLGWGAIFPSGDPAEVGRVTGNYGLSKPRHPGSAWLVDGPNGPDLIKSLYIQTMDKSKQHPDHHGVNVEQVSWSRGQMFGQRARTLEPGSARAAGPAYAARHTRMTPAYHAYLTGASAWVDDAQEAAEPVAVGHDGYAHTMDLLNKMGVPSGPPALGPADGGGEPGGPVTGDQRRHLTVVPTIDARKTWKQRVLEIAEAAGPGAVLERADFEDAMSEEDETLEFTSTRRQQLRNTLGALVEDGKLTRVDGGYTLATATVGGD